MNRCLLEGVFFSRCHIAISASLGKCVDVVVRIYGLFTCKGVRGLLDEG